MLIIQAKNNKNNNNNKGKKGGKIKKGGCNGVLLGIFFIKQEKGQMNFMWFLFLLQH